jgi:hypothetical protein
MKHHIQITCKLKMELVPPGCHQQNAAEVAIHNFKTHFLIVLAGVAENFPDNLCDRLLPQTEITLNLLRQSNATPNVSAYAHLSGPFDYSKMPLAPMGCAAQIHKKSDKRGTWQYHSVDRWYLYMSPNHYQTHACHIKTTKKERLTNTVDFQHKQITNPTIAHADKVMHAIQQVIQEIRKLGGIENLQEALDLQQPVNGAKDYLQSTDLLNTQPAPRVNHNQHSIGSKRQSDNCEMKQSLPRVYHNQHSIRSERQSDDREMKQSLPRVNQPTTRDKTPHNKGPPASRTQSKTTGIKTENAAAIRTKG